MKTCTKCNIEKPLSEFYKERDRFRPDCKKCNNEKSKKYHTNNNEKRLKVIKAWGENNLEKKRKISNDWKKAYPDKHVALEEKRRATKMKAVPAWFEKEKVRLVYKKAKELGMTVDHVVPLSSKIVCGLHCWYNLQLLDSKLNSGKKNYHWPDMP